MASGHRNAHLKLAGAAAVHTDAAHALATAVPWAHHRWMPLVAEAPGGLLDVTLPDLGVGVSWQSIHRVRPRAPLRCAACAGVLHAKVSPRGQRFFAHDARDRHCPLTAETVEHRLLKSALAAAVRQAGWHAALEVTAPDRSWRADVLATSPHGDRRVVWEAQLAYQHEQDTTGRTGRYTAAGIDVVWVVDKPVRHHHPRITVEVHQTSIAVTGPVVRLQVDHCDTTDACKRYDDVHRPPPCPGHGRWEPAALTLDRFVELQCQNAVAWVDIPGAAETRVDAGQHTAPAWTSPIYLRRAAALHQAQHDADAACAGERAQREAHRRAAGQRRQAAQQRHQQQAEQRTANLAALRERHTRLTPIAVTLVTRDSAQVPWTLPCDIDHAMGTSLIVNSRAAAVVCPIASRITDDVADRLAHLTIYVASDHERRAIARRCRPHQRIAILD